MAEGERILYVGRELKVLRQTEVCVAGGGTAGVAAAVMAARRGADVLVIERGIVLGGAQTQALVMPMMPSLTEGSDTPLLAEVKEKLRQRGLETSDGVTGNAWTNPEALAQLYDELTAEAGVQVLFGAVIVDALREDGNLQAVIVQTQAGLFAVRAEIFIDTTGDAWLARLAGVECESGSERTGHNQPMSFRFEMGGIDIDRLAEYIDSTGDTWCKTRPPYFEIAQARHRAIKYKLEEFFLRGVASGELTEEDAEYFQGFTIPGKPGCMALNCPELPVRFSPRDPLAYSEGVRYGRAMQRRVANYLIKHLPGFEKAYLSREASVLGARESWRIRGLYRLEEKDYYARRCFADAVARTAWYIDAHGEKVGDYLLPGEFYEIPYRALLTKEYHNLLVAGRCISASFIVQASLRIQPTCFSMGEAAGIAAAYCVRQGIRPQALAWDKLPPALRSYVSAGAKALSEEF